MRIAMFNLVIAGAAILLTGAGGAHGQTGTNDVELADPYFGTRIYTDSTGASHFAEMQIRFELSDFAPPAPPISVTSSFASQGFAIISSPVGWYGDWHPTPRIQFVFCLAGTLEVEVTDGEIRRFGPGSVVLLEDTTGKGHVSKVVGDQRVYMVAAPLAAGR